MEGATATANSFKNYKPDSFVVFVGGHVAALPVETLHNEKSIDAVCQNEGVYTLIDLLSLDRIEDFYLKKIHGLVFRSTDDEGIIQNPPSSLVPKKLLEKDLPGMAWDLLPSLTKYRTAGWHSWSNETEKEPFAALYTSLGCPYKMQFLYDQYN